VSESVSESVSVSVSDAVRVDVGSALSPAHAANKANINQGRATSAFWFGHS
jgi:hypothetical protein